MQRSLILHPAAADTSAAAEVVDLMAGQLATGGVALDDPDSCRAFLLSEWWPLAVQGLLERAIEVAHTRLTPG